VIDIGWACCLAKLQMKLLILAFQLQLLGMLRLQLAIGQCNLASQVQVQ